MTQKALLIGWFFWAWSCQAADTEDWSFHTQATAVTQEHLGFKSPYQGTNSFLPSEPAQTSLTWTLFGGRRLWPGAEGYLNPELVGGSGLSHTQGIAGFPNGEIYRVDEARPKWALSRAYVRQFIGLGGEQQHLEADANQLAGNVDVRRITIVAGKFSLNDFFDQNAYSHDPRTQFLNWALMDQAAWDYAADTRGYTWGLLLEYNQADWAVRYAAAYVPVLANSMSLDGSFPTARGDNLEFEYRYLMGGRKGVARILAFNNRARMGNYRQAIYQAAGGVPDITTTHALRSKYGFGINLEQEINPDLGAFFKAAWNDGHTESWVFTEADRSMVMGASLKGTHWNRREDTTGLAILVNGISKDHADYLSSGGLGFLLGDGHLNYAPEEIVEYYYLLQVNQQFAVTGDYQFVADPGYNQDRGPVSIFSGRIHYEF